MAASSRPIFRLTYQRRLLAAAWLAALACTPAAMAGDPAAAPAAQQDTAPAGDAIVLSADAKGHFGGTLRINGLDMPFIVDTGATTTAIPMKFALAARLPFGQQIETRTAGGRAFGKSTRVDSLQIGSIEIGGIRANLNQHLSTVLLGMNTLKYFHIELTADRLVLTVNHDLLAKQSPGGGALLHSTDEKPAAANEPAAQDVPAKPISKSVVCDAEKHCITRYGN